MNKHLIKILFLSSLCLCIFLIHPKKVIAATQTGFTIQPVLPTNQISDNNYFDLKVAPNQQQDIKLSVTNLQNNKIKIKISPNPAYTNSNGVIEYDKHKPTQLTSEVNIATVFSEPQKITLEPHEQREVTFKLKIPSQPFSGMLLGGFYAQRLDSSNSTSTSKQLTTVTNHFALVVGILLRENLETKTTPNLKFNKIDTAKMESQNELLLHLTNPTSQAFGKTTIKAKIYPQSSSKSVVKITRLDQEFAPTSDYNFTIPLGSNKLPDGKYRLELTATSGKKHWHFQQKFTIKTPLTSKLTPNFSSSFTPIANNNGPLILLALLVIILVLGLTIRLIKRNKKY